MRISATTLESFRLYMQSDQEWMSESDLIDSILGKFTTNRAVTLGKAYHAVIEAPEKYRVPYGYVVPVACEHCDGGYVESESLGDNMILDRMVCPHCGAQRFRFDDEVMDPALALVDRRGFFELKGTVELDGCTLVAKADHVSGAVISEFKTTCSGFDPDKYLPSVQWRVMALLFQPRVIRYHVCCLQDSDNDVIGFKSVESMNVFPYPGLREDVRGLLARFREFVVAKGLDGYLEQRQREAV